MKMYPKFMVDVYGGGGGGGGEQDAVFWMKFSQLHTFAYILSTDKFIIRCEFDGAVKEAD
jgi:hypothetical protein